MRRCSLAIGAGVGEDAGVLVNARDPSRVVELTLDGEGSGRRRIHPWPSYGRVLFLSMPMLGLAGRWLFRGCCVLRVVCRWVGGRGIDGRFVSMVGVDGCGSLGRVVPGVR